MKRIFFLVCIFLQLSLLSAEEYHVYNLEKVASFAIGTNDSQIGALTEAKEIFPDYKGPPSLSFKKDGSLVINDIWNSKLKIFNDKYELADVIPIEKTDPRYIEFIDDKVLFYYPTDFFIAYDNKGKLLCKIGNASYSPGNTNEYYYLSDNYLLKKKANGELFLIREPFLNSRKEISQKETLDILNGSERNGINGITIDEKGRLFVDGLLITRTYQVFYDYWYRERDLSTNEVYFTAEKLSKMRNNTYLGMDSSENYYWLVGSYRIIVINKGQVVKAIQFDIDKSKTFPTIHPSGDIYCLDYDKNGVYLYRIQNQWDSKGRKEWYSHITSSRSMKPLNKIGILNDDRVRIRKNPNLNGETLGHLNKGDKVTILGISTEKMRIDNVEAPWVNIKSADGIEGWVFGAFVDIQN